MLRAMALLKQVYAGMAPVQPHEAIQMSAFKDEFDCL
jgi:hypothetical protein